MMSFLFARPENRLRLVSFDLLWSAMFLASWLVFRSTCFAEHGQVLVYGVLFDLFVTAPAIYWIIWRTTDLSSVSFLPVLFVSFAMSFFLVPDSHRLTALPLQIVYGALVFATVIHSVRRFFRGLKNEPGYDIKQQIRQALRKHLALSKITSMIATELTTFYYLTRSARMQRESPIEIPRESKTFTYHKKNAVVALTIGLCIAITVEAIAVHFLLGLWSSLAAWLATISSIYFLLFVVAHLRSIKSRPSFANSSKIVIRNGIFLEAEIEWDIVQSLEKTGNVPDPNLNAFSLSVPANHNFVLHLKKEIEIEMIYGFRKKAKVVTGYVDDLERLASLIPGSESTA